MTLDWRTDIAQQRDARIAGSSLATAEPAEQLHAWLVTKLQQRAHGIKVKDVVTYKRGEDPHVAVITCGDHVTFPYARKDGVRCSFSIVLRDDVANEGAEILSYSFRVHAPDAAPSTPAYLRYDFDLTAQHDPAHHPRSHLHPGHKNLRAPAPVLTPRELIGWFLGLQVW